LIFTIINDIIVTEIDIHGDDFMNILIVGLGLIGGSLCKALKKYTGHTVIGSDLNKNVEQQALDDNSIDKIFDNSFDGIDLLIICLYPEAAEKYFSDNAKKIGSDTLISEVCGIKGDFAFRMKNIAESSGLSYVGIHPMAGKEFGGYINSSADLFRRANFIITPFEDSKESSVSLLKKLASDVGVGKIITTSPENHDKMIAYTSQLAHIISSAYIKSPQLETESGFSGGSFQDMTRIATMNENMWTDLFMQNRENLKAELDIFIDNLRDYSNALENGDRSAIMKLIREGRELKEKNLKEN
jgi:prephenate dehydrogenase